LIRSRAETGESLIHAGTTRFVARYVSATDIPEKVTAGFDLSATSEALDRTVLLPQMKGVASLPSTRTSTSRNMSSLQYWPRLDHGRSHRGRAVIRRGESTIERFELDQSGLRNRPAKLVQ
jgi:hypothetical protein